MDLIQTLDVNKCNNCKTAIIVPKHCGKPMELHDRQWVCWKGEHEPCCGKAAVIDFEACCDSPSL